MFLLYIFVILNSGFKIWAQLNDSAVPLLIFIPDRMTKAQFDHTTENNHLDSKTERVVLYYEAHMTTGLLSPLPIGRADLTKLQPAGSSDDDPSIRQCCDSSRRVNAGVR